MAIVNRSTRLLLNRIGLPQQDLCDIHHCCKIKTNPKIQTMTPTIHSHALLDTTTASRALAILRPHLPVSLPLYRRLQSGHFTTSSRLLTSLPILSPPQSTSPPYLLAFLDRSFRPETELWLFSSWDVHPPAPPTSTHPSLLRTLPPYISSLPLPPSIHPSLPTDTLTSYAAHAANPSIVLCGAIHASTVPVFAAANLTSPEFKLASISNHTFLWDVPALIPERRLESLPPGLRWGELGGEELDTVISRTDIPRQKRTLASLPSVGVFEEAGGKLVAWAFIGLDGSLTSLHVEPEWRSRGLAKVVTTRLFGTGMEGFWEDGVGSWACGFVVVGNEKSRRMCEGLGGRAEWEVTWVRMDLGRLSE